MYQKLMDVHTVQSWKNYVGQACRMHCLDHRSVFHMETNILWAKFYLLPPPPPPRPPPCAMLFVGKGLPKSHPTLHRGGVGRGERANIAGIREKGTVSHTFWPGLVAADDKMIKEGRTITELYHKLYVARNIKSVCTISTELMDQFHHNYNFAPQWLNFSWIFSFLMYKDLMSNIYKDEGSAGVGLGFRNARTHIIPSLL